MTREEWLRIGVELGYAAEPRCATHHFPPVTPEEELELEDGLDPCLFVVRLWEEPARDS